MSERLLENLKTTKIVAIIRGMEAEICVRLAKAYREAGIRLVEVTFDQTGDPGNTTQAIKAIKSAVGDEMHVGAGTVLTEAQLDAAIAAGAEFIVTPNVNPALIRKAKAAGLAALPGAFTPSEIVTAYEAGADVVKVFPIRSLGSAYVKDVLAPLKHIPLMAVGGVTSSNAGGYIAAGCMGVGVSGALVDKELIAAGEWDKITQEARRLVASVSE